MIEYWIPISILIQLAVGALLILAAIHWVEPVKKRRKTHQKKRRGIK